MSGRLAPGGVVESDLVAAPVGRRSGHVLSRFTARERGARFWAALWIAAIACEFGALVPVIFGRAEPVPGWEVVYRLIGGSFAACGLIAWRRRPDSRSGLLITTAGFCFFLFPLLSQIDAPATYDADGEVPAPVELAAYFVASEALTNVAKYARATVAQVSVTREGPRLVVEVANDGVGGADARGGSDLRGLADRVDALEGRLTIVSPPGAGTSVRAELPCGS